MAYETGAYETRVADPAPARSLVSWGAVFAGALIAAAVMTLLTLLWEAMAADSSYATSTFARNLNWWLAGSAILATFLAGFFAAWLARGRGIVVGLVQALTEWGVLTLAVVVIAPGVVTAFRVLVSASAIGSPSSVLWTSFWSVLIGLAAAVVGGLLGGLVPSPSTGRDIVVVPDRGRTVVDQPRARHVTP